jgi:hypothetical protein
LLRWCHRSNWFGWAMEFHIRRKTGEYNEFTTEPTVVFHDCTIFGCSYHMSSYSMVGKLCWLWDILDTLYWNIIFCVCFSWQQISAILIVHLSLPAWTLCVCLICAVFDFSDRLHTAYMPMVSLTDAVSTPHSYHSYPVITLICRGEWDFEHWTWLNIMTQ